MKSIFTTLLVAAAFTTGFSSCSDEDTPTPPPTICPTTEVDGLYVINSGNYGAGNSSLSFIDTKAEEVTNDFFRNANGMSLGDVAQSMSIYDDRGWIVVNNSSVIFAIDPATGKEKGRIDSGLTSPRNIYFVSSTKAYVTQLYDNRIAVVNPTNYSVTNYITIPEMEAASGSTEQMVISGNYAYCTCWSYQKSVVKIDLTTDRVIAKTEVGIQPKDIVIDADGNLRILTDGGWDGNPLGYEAPAIVTLNPSTMQVTSTMSMTLGDYVSNLTISPDGSTLYWLNGNKVMCIGIHETAFPTTPYVQGVAYLNAMTIDPTNGDLYVADALDYVQRGAIYRYVDGELTDTYTVGIIPTSFCWFKK